MEEEDAAAVAARSVVVMGGRNGDESWVRRSQTSLRGVREVQGEGGREDEEEEHGGERRSGGEQHWGRESRTTQASGGVRQDGK